LDWRFGERTHQAQECRAAGRLLLPSAQPTARSTSQNQSDVLEIGAQPSGPPRITFHQSRHLLDEGLAWTSCFVTAKAADLQMDDGLPVCNWQVGNAPDVATVKRFRPACTGWTGRTRGGELDKQVHHFTTQLYVLEYEPGADRQQLLRVHTWGGPVDAPGRGG